MGTIRKIEILNRLLDGIEYMDSGLCRLNYIISFKEHGCNYEEDLAYKYTKDFLSIALPYPKYNTSRMGYISSNIFSWPTGDHDRRFYWLKSELKYYKENN